MTACPDFIDGSPVFQMFNSLPEGIIVWDADRKLVFANQAARDIVGTPLTVGLPLQPVLQRTYVLDTQHAPANRDSLPVYRAFSGEDVPREDMRLIAPDGTHKWLSVGAVRILDENGNLAFVISSMRDISVRKSREDKLTFMVESAKILSLNLDFKQRLIEKAKLTVPSLADWCGMTVVHEGALIRVSSVHRDPARMAAFQAYDETYARDGLKRIIESKQPVLLKVVDDASLQSLHVSPAEREAVKALGIKSLMVIPIVSRGEGVGAMTLAYAESGRTYSEDDLEFFQEFCHHVSVIFDNAKLFDEIQKRDKAKDMFLATLSHELRNPLAPIKSALELLRMKDVSSDVKEEINIIEHQFDHMARLLNDLLDATRFTQDRIALTMKAVDLRKLLERALKGADALIRNADITLHFTYPSSQMTVLGDETRLEQAIANLLSNAIKFTPAGGSIWVELEEAEGDAVIRVRDSGAGISEDDLPKIFDLYYQGTRSGIMNSGLGIGLVLVQRIVELHKGRIIAKSEGPGTGSEFVITLPRSDAQNAESSQRGAPAIVGRGMRILVVDDNAPAADSLARLLNKLGCAATAVYSGHEVLGQNHLETIDLFLLDLGMPQMDGYELVRALRTRGISAPIVALTGYGLDEDKKRATDAGFTSHLTKPVGMAELTDMIDRVSTVTA